MKKESKIFKAFRYLCLSFVVVIGLVAIIGTGGGGGGGGGGGTTPLATGEFTKTAQLDSNGNWSGHFNSGITDIRVQQLYLADGIDGSGYITAIAFKSTTTTAAEITCPDLTLKIGHTSLSALTNTFANNVEQGKGSVETVLTNAQVVVPVVSSGDYFEIQLDTPFYYNGVDNLVVDFIRTGVCDDSVQLSCDMAFLNGSLWSTNLASPIGTLAVGLNMEFHFEGGVDALEFAPLPSAGNSIPFGVMFGKVQLLYDATVIDGSGPITGIAMRIGGAATTDQSYTYTMRVGHTTLTDLTTDFNGNFSGTPVTVADNAVFNVPAGVPVGDYIWIPMPDGSFNYNGTDNLIVEVDVSSSTGITPWGRDIGTDMTRAYGDSGSGTASGVDNRKYHISFRFNGGTMDVITAEDMILPVPFYGGGDYKTQIMFGAQQLGTGGSVTGISFRLAADSVLSDYPAATVVLGHTADTVMSMTFADNMTDPTTVFTGTLNVPAGLKAGDWVTIPVSGFTYDSTQNLVVEVTQDAGTVNNVILLTNVDVPGASGVVTGPRVNPIATISSPGQSDIRVHLSK